MHRRRATIVAIVVIAPTLAACGDGFSAECESMIARAKQQVIEAPSQVGEIDAKIDEIRNQFDDGRISFDEMTQGIDSLRKERNTLQPNFESLISQCGSDAAKEVMVNTYQ